MEVRIMQNPSPSVTQGIMPCPQCGTGVKFRVDPTSDRKSCPHCGYVLPHQIAHFRLLQIIGTGGMGAVYRGLDTSLERNVAVKVMREEFAKNPQFVESFLREARAAASLNHPNVAQIYSFGEQNSRYYLVMELLANGSLDDRIEKEHRLPEIDVIDVGIQVAGGLRAAYERGLIHRDIKPGNILFAQDGSAKVVDFGLARFEAKTGQEHQEEGIWGTPYYIAPEKVSDNQEDFRSDIYSLGGTLFHALAGRAPFEAGTSTEVVLKHLRSPAVSLKAFAPDTTPQTAEVIGRMLKRNPAERPQSYDELLNDLAYAKRFALEKKPHEHVEAESEFSMGMLVSTLAIIVICLIAAVWLWFNRSKFPGFAGSEAPKPPVGIQASFTNAPPSRPPKVQPPPTAVPSPPDFPFQIERAHEEAGRDNIAGALSQLEQIQKALPENHSLQPWVRLDTARIHWLSGRPSEAVSMLQEVAASTSPESLGNPIAGNFHPPLLALILLGKIQGEALDKILPGLPDWMQAIASFDAGLSAIHQEQLPEAKRRWQAYAKIKSVSGQVWTLTFQPMARDFSNEYDQFHNAEKEIADLEAAGKLLEIQHLLKEQQVRWQTPAIRTQIAKLTEANRQAILKFQNEIEDKQKLEQAKLLESEGKLIEEVKARAPPLLKSYQFGEFLELWKKLGPSMKTESNHKAAQYHAAVAQSLLDFQQRIVKDVLDHPYDQERVVTRTNQKMLGKLYQIKDGKLHFRIEFAPGQFGELACRWVDLPPSAILELGDFYLVRAAKLPEPNNSELARRAIALAVFAREFSLPDSYVRKYLSLAMQTSANIKDSMEQLFPSTPLK